MATTYKILGQLLCTYNTEQLVYTVPSSTQTIVSTVVIANHTASAGAFTLSVRPSAEASTSAKNYLFYKTEVPANSSFVATIGATLYAGDKIHINSVTEASSVTIFGSEVI
jgi:hypothetical protein